VTQTARISTKHLFVLEQMAQNLPKTQVYVSKNCPNRNIQDSSNNKPQTIVCSSQYGFAYMAIISVQVVTSAVGTMKNI